MDNKAISTEELENEATEITDAPPNLILNPYAPKKSRQSDVAEWLPPRWAKQ